MKKVNPYQAIASVLVVIIAAAVPYFLTNLSKVNAEQATEIAQTQARLVVGDELKEINKRLSDISGNLKALTVEVGIYNKSTRRRL